MVLMFIGIAVLLGYIIGLLRIVRAELIGRRPNTMQPVVRGPDAPSDLSLGRSGDRQRIAKFVTFIKDEIEACERFAPSAIGKAGLISRLKSIAREAETLLGPQALKAQDEPEKP